MQGLSLVVASGGHSSSRCTGFSLLRPLLLRSTGSRRAGSVVVAHGPSCSAACGIFPDQGSNPRPLHWQADSQPLRHQGSPTHTFLNQTLKGPHDFKKCTWGTSLVVQWLRICLPMQGTRVRALVREDPTCRGATKPASHNCWARVTQLLKLVCLEPVLHDKKPPQWAVRTP